MAWSNRLTSTRPREEVASRVNLSFSHSYLARGGWPRPTSGFAIPRCPKQRQEIEFPLHDGFAHFIYIKRAVVHVGNGCNHTSRLQGPELVVQQTLDDVGRHLQLRELGGERPAEVQELPGSDLADFLKLPFRFPRAVPRAHHIPAGKQQISAVEARNGLKNVGRKVSISAAGRLEWQPLLQSSAADPISAHLRPQALARYPKQLRRF